MKRKLAARLASSISARENCANGKNPEWYERHYDNAQQMAKDQLPCGSGFDNGTYIDWMKSTGEKLVLLTSFHHMNESGMYDGWTEHTVTVTPAFHGINLKISGRDKNEIKEYIAECFYTALTTETGE